MVKTYKRYGTTTGGYRGERAILEERVIEGLEQAEFTNQILQLDSNSPRTIYLTADKMASGDYIVLPNAETLWPNWQVSIINESSITCPIYYYTSDYEQLSLFKEVTGGNMVTCILLNDDSEEGTWTTLRTVEQSSLDLLDRYVSDVYDELQYTYNELSQDITSLKVSLGVLNAGYAIKSTYIKATEAFAGNGTMTVSIGTEDNETRFSQVYDLTQAVSDTNFTKDIFDEIISTEQDTEIFAFFKGGNFNNLTSGSVKLVVQKAKLIDPTILKNPIVQTQIPIGVIMNYAFTDVPNGYWKLDGTIFPNATASIPNFVTKLTTINNQMSGQKLIVGIDEWNSIFNTYGSCPKFAWVGTGLKFPAINGFIRGLSDISQLSSSYLDGLPNITGEVVNSGVDDEGPLSGGSTGTGAFRASYNGRNGSDGSARGGAHNFNFDASRSSAVYGRATEVQPKHVKFPYIISIYSKIQNASTLVLDEILEASVYKANTDLDNLSSTGINYLSNLINTNISSQSGRKIAPNYAASYSIGQTFTAPVAGWIMAYCGSGDWDRVQLTVNGVTYLYTGRKSYNTATCLTAFLDAGDSATVVSNGARRFIPCKG